jgi:hypothetical protein
LLAFAQSCPVLFTDGGGDLWRYSLRSYEGLDHPRELLTARMLKHKRNASGILEAEHDMEELHLAQKVDPFPNELATQNRPKLFG